MKFSNYEYEIKYGNIKILSYNGDEEEVIIPDKIDGKNVYTICSNAFFGLKNLRSIAFPKTVGCIQDAAICDCENLEKIYLPIVEDLGNFIEDCSDNILVLTPSPRMANKVQKMDANLGIYCEKDFKYSIKDEVKKECVIDKAKFRGLEVSIPDILDGYKVVGLNFYLESKIQYKRIKLPKYLKKIPAHFCSNQKHLKSLEMGDCIKEISDYAFYMTKVNDSFDFVISNKVKKIGKYAFSDSCFNISFEEGTNLEVGDYSFAATSVDASNLEIKNLTTGLFYKSKVSNYFNKSISAAHSVFRKASLINFKGFENFKQIENYAFSEAVFEDGFSLDLSNISKVGLQAFSMTLISEIFIPKNFKLTEGLFSHCKSKRITFDDDYDGDIIPSDCFRGIVNLESFEVPKSIRNIGNNAFCGCTNLLDFNFEGIETIGAGAFSDTGIREAIFGKGLISMGRSAFSRSSIKKVFFNESPINCIQVYCFEYCRELEELSLNNSITRIERQAFSDTALTYFNSKNVEIIDSEAFNYNRYLKEVDLSKVKVIGNGAFRYCNELENVTLGDELERLDSYVFYGCNKITNINLPASIKGLGNYCFDGTSLREFILPAKVNKIFPGIFTGMRKIEKIVLNNLITEIPTCCFNNLPIKELVIGENVKTLEMNAILRCHSLEKLILPKSIKNLRHDSIQSCSKLKEVYILGTLDVLNTGVFNDCPNLETIHTDDFESAKKLVKRSSNSIKEFIPIDKELPKKRTRKVKTK